MRQETTAFCLLFPAQEHGCGHLALPAFRIPKLELGNEEK
jgi:hypothetical protein